MAKTKLLAEIGTQSDAINTKITALVSKLAGASALDNSHWDAFTAIKTDLDKLDLTISKLEQRMKSWDGSTKLRDIFKKKAVLAKARQDALDKAKVIRADAAFIHETVDNVIAAMKQVKPAAAH